MSARIEELGERSGFSSSGSSSLPGPVKIELSDRSTRDERRARDTSVHSDNPSLGDSNHNSSSRLLFNPNEKGTKKQKRCDYDSDARSYDGLGFDYKRRHLSTTARRDTLLPGTTKMIDFDHQGDKAWGRRLLFESLKDSDIDSLVGLATSLASPLSTSSNADDTFHNPQKHNPLLLATCEAPLPPSNIDYIKSRLRHHVLESTRDEIENRCKRKKKNINRECIALSLNDSAAVAMGIYLEECITASLLPLAGLHALRCQALEAMESAESELGIMPVASFISDKDDNKDRLSKVRDNMPAYVLQQTVPHPITGEKVKLDMNNQIRWKEEKAFHQWTLPAEEAILKLSEQGVLLSDSPYHFVPNASRSYMSTRGNQVPNRRALDIASWAKSYKVNQRAFSANREICDIFLPQKIVTHEKGS